MRKVQLRENASRLLPLTRMLVTVVVFAGTIGLGQPLNGDLPVANNLVEDMVQDGSTLYIGGWFTHVGPNTGHGVVLDQATGLYDKSFPKVNGTVYACVSDSQGGWYIGGSFSKVGSVLRGNVAHIMDDGTVDAWNPGTNGTVRAIALSGSTVYFGGFFSQVGGASRNYAAAVDAATGVPTAWSPDPDGAVWAIAATNSTAYIGGLFGSINGQAVPRSNLAAVDATSGAAISWNPGVALSSATLPFCVYGLLLADHDSTLYVWGNIATIGGAARKGVGAVQTYGSAATLWNPTALYNGAPAVVYALARSGDTVYIGGSFNKMKTTATTRNKVAALTRFSSGTVLPWNPNISGVWPYSTTQYPPVVSSMAISEGVVYVGGAFGTIGSTARNNLAAIDAKTGLATEWDPHAPDGYQQQAYALCPAGTNLYAGGGFGSMNGIPRNGLAAIDLVTNTITSWDPALTEDAPWLPVVNHVAHYGSTVYVGGTFAAASGLPRRNFAAISKTTGLPLDFLSTTTFGYPAPFVAANGSKLYVSGEFTTIGDSARNRLACIDLTSGNVTAWDPHINRDFLYAIAFSGSTIYMAGNFDSVGSIPRHNLAAVDDVVGNANSWNPHTDPVQGVYVRTMQVSGSTVYVGGEFDAIASTPRNKLAAVDAATGTVTAWDPNCSFIATGNAGVYDIRIVGNTMYLGGYGFSGVGGVSRLGVASIDIPAAAATSWNPSPDAAGVYALLPDPDRQTVYIGGGFGTMSEDAASNLACYGDPTLSVPSTITSMRSGWNLVSVPRVPSDFARTALFPTAVDFYSYLSGSYTTPTTLQNGEGYWGLYSAATDNTISGSSLGSTSLVVPTGGRWVIIGSLTSSIAASAITTSPAGQIVGGPYAYDGTSYVLATTLEPGKAYWMLINNPCTILLH